MKSYKFLIMYLLISIGNQTNIFAQTTIENENLTVNNLDGKSYTLSNNSELIITNPSSSTTGTVNITSDSGWLILEGILPSEAISNHLSYITVNGQPSVHKTNIRITNYLLGSVIMAHSETFQALSAFKGDDFGDDEMKFAPETYYKSAQLLEFDNSISSFKLKKGYMVTFAENEDGTGYSKVYIADNDAMEIETLPTELNNKISFVRVFPWRYTTKKGIGSGVDFDRTAEPIKRLNGTWFYTWRQSSLEDLTDVEFVPMKWSGSSFTDPRWQEIVDLTGVTHLLGFNEPDSDGQSDMSVEEMIAYWPKMMESGLRLGSPAPASVSNGVLYDFMEEIDRLNYRVDFVNIHDYRHGTAQDFYNLCKQVHDKTGKPIWITEFNYGGWWNVSNTFNPDYQTAASRIQEIVERYDEEGIIERYAIFNFDQEEVSKAVFYNPGTDYNITHIGEVYKNHVSSMAYNSKFSIDSDQVNIALNKPATASSHYNNYTPNLAVDGDAQSTTSRWLVKFSDNPLPAWLEVDLQGTYTVNSYFLDEAGNSQDFQLQYWNTETETWEVGDDVKDNPDSRDYFGNSFTPFTTNKVRLYITAHNRTDYLRLFEFEIYGEETTLSLENNTIRNNINLYPNPTKGNVEILLNTGMEKIVVELVNMLGQSISSKSYSVNNGKIYLDVKDHENGLYFVIVKAEVIQSFKLLKH